MVAPLSAHGVSDALVGARAFLPAIRAMRHEVNALLAAIDAVGWLELGQVVEPEAGGLDLAVAVLPRLDDLIGWADGRADHADGIFNAPTRDWGIHEQAHEVESFSLFPLLAMEVSTA